MAVVHEAVLSREVERAEAYAVLEFEALAPIAFDGGQYIIVHTGAVGEGGRPVKRSYSLLPAHGETRFRLAVQSRHGGLGSAAMLALTTGDILQFSGPWGRKRLPRSNERALLVATDTGLSTIASIWLSCSEQGKRQEPLDVLLLEGAGMSLPQTLWREAERPAQVHRRPLPEVGHPERNEAALGAVRAVIDQIPSSVLMAGDGAVLRCIEEELAQLGVDRASIVLESHFNKPSKAS